MICSVSRLRRMCFAFVVAVSVQLALPAPAAAQQPGRSGPAAAIDLFIDVLTSPHRRPVEKDRSPRGNRRPGSSPQHRIAVRRPASAPPVASRASPWTARLVTVPRIVATRITAGSASVQRPKPFWAVNAHGATQTFAVNTNVPLLVSARKR